VVAATPALGAVAPPTAATSTVPSTEKNEAEGPEIAVNLTRDRWPGDPAFRNVDPGRNSSATGQEALARDRPRTDDLLSNEEVTGGAE
jgi:hypothetical protein